MKMRKLGIGSAMLVCTTFASSAQTQDISFQPAGNFPAGTTPFSVAVGDFNSDGIPDLALADFFSEGAVAVLLGNGDGYFQPPCIFTVGSFPFSLAVADFDGDGRADLAVANSGWANVSVLLGNGDGTFQPSRDFP